MRLFAYALLTALALCDSAWCVEQESAEDRYALVEPLTRLADALIAAGRPADAIEPLTRAVNILRRSSGLYDQRQYALLSQLTDLHSLGGDFDAAAAALAYMERISEHGFIAASSACAQAVTSN